MKRRNDEKGRLKENNYLKGREGGERRKWQRKRRCEK
jgi:hypothetical protein